MILSIEQKLEIIDARCQEMLREQYKNQLNLIATQAVAEGEEERDREDRALAIKFARQSIAALEAALQALEEEKLSLTRAARNGSGSGENRAARRKTAKSTKGTG
jgi:beta-glucosidase-like glycosyl hydrolase